ncbi:PaaI family thioesterase [Bacillus sp. RD4P76]|uniref:PaaI family thioesterase n=1 Tax=Bacillus suaedaesalsae TaxID=2810349 RepID=A0ABS2DM38_9BACI|nr:PaaI family thioesterase [Bacillus suaedaesalsae]
MKIQEQVDQYLQNATEKDQEVLEFVLEGLLNKQNQINRSYLGGLLHETSYFNEEELTFHMTIPNSSIIQNALNIAHGGITATLLDSAMGTLAIHVLPSHLAAVTTEIKINYVGPGIGEKLTCDASIIHKGSKIIVCEGKVYRDDGKLVAHSTASFFIIPRVTKD